MRVMRRHQKRRNTLGKGQPIHQIISILSHGHLKYCYYTHPPPYLTFFAGIISNKCLRFKKSPGRGGGVSSVHTLGACVASNLASCHRFFLSFSSSVSFLIGEMRRVDHF